MIPAVIAAAALALASVLAHYEVLRAVSCLLPTLRMPPRPKILVVICSALLGHVFEVGLYAGVFRLFIFGDNSEHPCGIDPVEQAIYLSIESFASLGTSICSPVGPLRLIAGSEALLGLILIGWTASYTYLAMRDLWGQH
jgi:hypothetical protein